MQRAFSRLPSTWLTACRIARAMDSHHDSAGCSCQVGWGVSTARGLYPLATDLPRQSQTMALQAVVLQSRPRSKGEGSFIDSPYANQKLSRSNSRSGSNFGTTNLSPVPLKTR